MAEIINLRQAIFLLETKGVKKPQHVLNCSLGNLSKMKNVYNFYIKGQQAGTPAATHPPPAHTGTPAQQFIHPMLYIFL